jgi:phosphoglucomutase/phosphomannomutase
MTENLLKQFDITTQENIRSFLKGNYDQDTKNSIIDLLNTNPAELKNSFYKKLDFGTGGIRALMGVGPNRVNKYTIRAATQGLSNYLLKEKKDKEIKVIIGYDNRHNSLFFAEQAACVLASNNIKALLFKTLCPTPIVSFGCRYKNCDAGIMVTASHNAPEYNGYKVYWNDGAQVLSPHDKEIIKEVNAIEDLSSVKTAKIDNPLIEIVGEEIFEAYLAKIQEITTQKKETKLHGKDLKIIYTSLHGAGITILPRALKNFSLSLVKKQCSVDENFTFAKNPNPENKEALNMGIDLLIKEQADILIATDPDADRMGVVANNKGTPVILTGNQIACILLNHILKNLYDTNSLKTNAAFVKTIVTTELFSEITKSYNKPTFDVLTGFKYIAQKIREWEINDIYKFVFGAEESLGFLREDFVRDKDAISAACLISEIAICAKIENKTLVDNLHEIYQEYGVFRESQISLTLKEKEITNLMQSIRLNPPKMISNYQISCIEDYQKQEKINYKTNTKTGLDLPVSNVLRFFLDDNSKIVIRPSGTEPKIKIYIEVSEKNFSDTSEAIKLCDTRLQALKNAIMNYLQI